jgi:hypothetical protein
MSFCWTKHNQAIWTQTRGEAFVRSLEPSIIERHEDGTVCFDQTHPVFRAAMFPRFPSPMMPTAPQFPNGLGTRARQGIDFATIGLGKPIAEMIAKVMKKKGCGCRRRERCLNELVPDVGAVTVMQMVSLIPSMAKCLGVKE